MSKMDKKIEAAKKVAPPEPVATVAPSVERLITRVGRAYYEMVVCNCTPGRSDVLRMTGRERG